MRSFFPIAAVVSAALLFSSCRPFSRKSGGEDLPPKVERLIPDEGDGSRRDAEAVSLEQRVNSLLSQVRVPMSPDDYLLNVLNENLDIDQLDEQIVVFKKKNDPEDRIRLLVADFDNVRNSYVVSWQGETQGTNNRSFNVEIMDLLGDHILEILCFGRNNRGEQTLDVFRKTPSPQGFGVYYSPIASIASQGSIVVEERPRSEAYLLLQKNDESFPLAVYDKDPDSENINDLRKTTHYWSYQDGRYKAGKTEKLAGQGRVEKRLADLFSRDAEGFESFLSGPWYRTRGAGKAGPGEIIHFDPQNRRIVFYNGEIQEIFLWQTSYRTIYKGLYINCVNEAIGNITKQLSVSVTGLDEFDLVLKGGEGWEGQYKRLGKDLQAATLASRGDGVRLSTLELSGLYRNENGVEVYFTPPRFTMRENGREFSGGFALYSFDGEIMEMKILKENGIVDSTRTYRLLFQEERQGNRILRNLTLQPARVTGRGVEIRTSGGPPLRLQQITEPEG